MKHSAKKQNPILQPLPLAAIITSTLAMIFAGFYTLPSLFQAPLPQKIERTVYQCEACGRPNVFNNAITNQPSFDKDTSKNFHPVITKISQGRYRHIIETKNLLLREVTLNDVPTLTTYYRKIENSASSTWKVHDASQESRKEVMEIIEHYRAGKQAHWAICEKNTGTIMGLGGFNCYIPSDHRATIGWWIDSNFWGRGYATEVGRACIEYGMKYLHLNHIDAIVRVDNIASRKVLEKSGMSLTACFRQYWRVKDELLSHYQYVVLKKDIAEQLKKSKV